MKNLNKILTLAALSIFSSTGFAAPLPHTIVVQDKAVVPVLKIEVIRTIKGQAPVRQVAATIFEVSNKGKDIIAREVYLEDNQTQFSEKKLAVPVLQKGSVIVPTSKIEVATKLTQQGQTLAERKEISAEGVEFKEGQAPVRRGLKLDQESHMGSPAKVSHAVLSENGHTTKDVVILSKPE